MIPLRQSTAVTVIVGGFVDDTDFKTAETALTISPSDVRLSKNGAADVAKNEATNATHRSSGMYAVPLDATDTNTVGRLTIWIEEAGALIVGPVRFQVFEEAIFDALFASGADGFDANGRVSVVNTAAGAITASSFAAGAIDQGAIADSGASKIRSYRRGTTSSAGTTSTLIDSSLDETDDFWNGNYVLITTGANAGQIRRILDWTFSTTTLQVYPAFDSAVASGVSYEILSTSKDDVNVDTVKGVDAPLNRWATLLTFGLEQGTVLASPVPTRTTFKADGVLAAGPDAYVGRSGLFITGTKLFGRPFYITGNDISSVWTVDKLVEAPAAGDSFFLLP